VVGVCVCVCVCVTVGVGAGGGCTYAKIHSFKVLIRNVSLMSYSHLNLGRWFGMIRGGGGDGWLRVKFSKRLFLVESSIPGLFKASRNIYIYIYMSILSFWYRASVRSHACAF